MADDAFNETTDGVKAKLTVEVPEQALTTLSQLAKQTEAYRISMEAAARATGNHQDYLEKMPTIADVATKKLKEWCDQVEHAVELKGKLGGLDIPGATGQDSSNPFGVQTMGRGDLATMAHEDPNRMVSMGAQRGMVAPGAVGGMNDEQVAKLANAIAKAVGGDDSNDGGGSGHKAPVPGRKKRTEDEPDNDEGLSPKRMEELGLKGRDLLGKLINETGPGSSMGDAVGAGRDLLGMTEGAGGMLGKVGSFLGPVGAGVGLALTANQLLQMGGEKYQGYKNLGGEAGGGAAEGMGYDAQAKMLALDPFISTAQAREVIQGALSAGHSGASFDKVTDFLATNLKDMNMSVSDSVSVLKTNVEEGGMSIQQLSASLSNLTDMAKNGTQSRSELQNDFASNTAALAGMGIGNQGQIAEQFMGAFQGSPLMASVGTSVIQTALSNPAFINAMGNETGIRASTPEGTLRKLADSGKLSSAAWSSLAKVAKQVASAGGDPYDQIAFFQRQVSTMFGLQISPQEAKGLFDQLVKPGGADAATQAGAKAADGSSLSAPINQSFWDQSKESLGSLADQAGNLLGGVGNIAADLFTGNWSHLDDDGQAVMDRKGQINREHEANNAKYTNQNLQNAVKEYGVDNLRVYDPGTKKYSQLDQSNETQRDALAANQLMLSQRGAAPQYLKDLGSMGGGGTNVSVQAAPITVTYQGPITGPTSVPLTANQMKSNTGYPGATLNNPDPGDR